MIEPLNTEAGQNFIRSLCTIVQPDALVFDNVQALLSGVQKEEECWTPTLPLVMWLTHRRIGQLWLDHTGHVSDRQYGSVHQSVALRRGRDNRAASRRTAPTQETAFILSFDIPESAAAYA